MTEWLCASSGKRWAVRKSGSDRALRTFASRAEAIAFAFDTADSRGGAVYLFGEDGRLSSVWTGLQNGNKNGT